MSLERIVRDFKTEALLALPFVLSGCNAAAVIDDVGSRIITGGVNFAAIMTSRHLKEKSREVKLILGFVGAGLGFIYQATVIGGVYLLADTGNGWAATHFSDREEK